MAGIRINVDYFFPGTATLEDVAKLCPDLLAEIVKAWFSTAVINPGTENQENTSRATYHLCYHDEDPRKPCGKESDIDVL